MKLVVALDLPSRQENLQLAEKLKEFAPEIWLKVGFRSFIRDGLPFLEELKKMGFPLFLDLKLYDIPNTLATAGEEIGKLGVEMFNIHLSAGRRGIETLMERLEKLPNRPLVLGVTILTSFSPEEVEEIYGAPLEEKALQLAKMGYSAGIDGVVCSVWESRKIKEATSSNFLTLTPGIRPVSTSTDDQKRVATPLEARRELVDFIVVGRPIYTSPTPEKVVAKLLGENGEKSTFT